MLRENDCKLNQKRVQLTWSKASLETTALGALGAEGQMWRSSQVCQ